MNLCKQYTPKDGYTALVKPGKDGMELLEAGLLRLSPGAAYRGESQGSEVCLVLLGGLGNLTAGETEFPSIGGRATVFGGRATAAHIPPGCKFKLEAIGALEAFLVRAPSDLAGEPRLIGPERVKVSTRGQEGAEWTVHDILDPGFPSQHLLVGETFSQDGRWSSYPPHKHDTANPPHESRHEGVCLYRLNPPQGFACQRVYSPERKFDQAYLIRDNSCLKLPFGYHPVAAAPGYALYSLWALAGQPRACTPSDDPDHAWVKQR